MSIFQQAWDQGNWLVRLPLLKDKTAWLRLPRNLTAEEWEHFQNLLDVMTPGIVVEVFDGREIPTDHVAEAS